MPRTAVLDALSRWNPLRNNLDDLLEQPLRRFDARDAALARHLAEECIRHLRLLDFWIDRMATPAGKARTGARMAIEAEVRDILRLGLAQLRFSRIPVHAAVDTSANLAPARARGFVNALLRRAAREPGLLDQWAREAPPAVHYSLSDDLWRHWERNWGATEAVAMARASQSHARAAFFPNVFHPEHGMVMRDPEVEPWPGQDGYFRHAATISVAWLAEGLVVVQDPAAALATALLAPAAGEKILDACAAPGGKAHRLACLAGGQVDILATDLPGRRMDRLQANFSRLRTPSVRVLACDWTAPTEITGTFDAVLVDAPCTNTGVLRRRLDARHRFSEATLAQAVGLQAALLRAVAPLVRPGGRLIYSTCSLEPEENAGQMETFLSQHPDWKPVATRQSMPHRDLIDGHFAARLEKDG